MVRRAAVAVVLLACACTADAAATSTPAVPDTPVEAGRRAVAPEAQPRPAAAEATNPVAAPVEPPAAAPDPSEVAAMPSDACAASVDELAPSPLVEADDPRLRRGALVVVDKGARRLMLFDRGRQRLCLAVGLGFAPTGHKQIQGDGRTPEGWYRLSDKPWSSFDNAIAVHYPNEVDARAAARDGRISGKTRDRIVADLRIGRVPPQATKLGGAILIHGGGSMSDWTLGCIALDDPDLLTLREALPRGMRSDLLVLP